MTPAAEVHAFLPVCNYWSGYHAECSCGHWSTPARFDWTAPIEHEALAEHAAHVHVALGLAEGGDA